MKIVFSVLFLFFILNGVELYGQTTFDWSGSYGGVGASKTYSITTGGNTMSATIVNSQNVWDNTAGTSPGNGTSLFCAGASGLILGTNWSINSGNIVVTITYTTPVPAPLTFSIKDINSNSCDEVTNSQDCYFWDEVVVTATTASAAGILPVATIGSGQTNSTSGNNRIIRAKPEASSGTYSCYLNSFTVGTVGQCVKTITITYRNYTGESNPISGGNPNFQYIVILPITTSAPPAAPTAVSYPAFCAGSSVTLTGTGTTASSNWYTAGCNTGSVVGTGTNISVSPSSATTYYVSNSDCGYCKSQTVTPTALGAGTISPVSASICDGSLLSVISDATVGGDISLLQFQFNATAPAGWGSLGDPATDPYTFDWTSNVAGMGLNPAVTNTAYLQATFNNSGCTATAMTSVEIKPLPAPVTSDACTGDVIHLTSSGGGSYLWSGPNSFTSNVQSPAISPAAVVAAGWYFVTVTGANGCKKKDSTLVVKDENCTLPITLQSFSGECTNSFKTFNWTTVSEINNDFFTLERSSDAVSFEIAAIVDGQGNSNSLVVYEFAEQDVLSNYTYYRLKQTDFDGQFAYSDIITVSCNNSELSLEHPTIFPNPAKENLVIDFGIPLNSEIKIQIVDLLGRTVIETYYHDFGMSTVNVSINDLSKGVYFVRIENTLQLHRFIKE